MLHLRINERGMANRTYDHYYRLCNTLDRASMKLECIVRHKTKTFFTCILIETDLIFVFLFT